ncbi:hypothetical protein EC968_000053 [Mortierella alpina]|nr:hypothetical protein EC968_000053 [Mortierella alpina]
MSKNQSLRLIGTTEIVTIPIQHANGQDLVCWESIEQVFPRVKSVNNGGIPVPHYIKHVPDEVLTVVLSNTTEHSSAESCATSMIPNMDLNSGQTVRATDARADGPGDPLGKDSLVESLRVLSVSEERPRDDIDPHNTPIDIAILPPTSSFGSDTTLKTALSFIEALKRASKKAKEVHGQASPQEDSDAMAPVIKMLEAAETRQKEMMQSLETAAVEREKMKMQALKLQQEVKQSREAADAKGEEIKQQAERHHQEVKQLQNDADAKQEKMMQQIREKQLEIEQLSCNHHEEIKQLQIDTLDQLARLHSRVQAVFTQNFELHEYPIPRLFIVLPQYPSGWNILEPFTEKYRLYFLCECGEHTKAAGSNSKIPHKIHLAKHEGYEIARPTEFFQQYGPYLLTILKMLKFGVSVASVAVPAVAHLVNSDALDHAAKGLQHLKECIGPGMDQVISKIEKASVDGVEPVENFAEHMDNKEALEGADLRKLETFLKDKDENKVLGNLYRTVTDEGHVKWVCIDHYRENYNQTAAAIFRRTVESLGGSFDENNGLVKVKLRSRVSANRLCMALRTLRSVHELDIDLDWACTATDVKTLVDALKDSAIAILHVDVQQFRPRFTNKVSSISTRYESLYHLMNLPNVSSIHIALPKDLNNFSDFTQKRPPHLRKLSFAMVVGRKVRIHAEIPETGCMVTTWHLSDYRMGSNGAQPLADALNNLTSLDLSTNSIGDNGAEALSEALKTNSTLTALNLSTNSIGYIGAQALSEALKANSTLTNVILMCNSIGDLGALALSAALKINSTLTTLNLTRNSISNIGAQALSEALKMNSTLTHLHFSSNSFRCNGAQALSKAIQTNSTLTKLDLYKYSIGYNGAQARWEALKTNWTLTTVGLGFNSTGDNGAQALSEALKTNSTLTTLDLGFNSTGDNGAQALSEALKMNSTLTKLDLYKNSIGYNGAQALSEALKTNSTLTTLDLGFNSTGDQGAQALSEALKVNSTLTKLNFGYNSIGDNGAQALSEALRINLTLITLSLWYNSIGDNGAQALSEALKINLNLTFLDLNSNSIGDNGAQALSEALKRNSTLTTLELGSNSIGYNGAQALSDALRINSTLTTLRLWCNSIGDNGAQALSDALKINSNLAILNLDSNAIGENGAQALSEALRINSTLTTLRLSYNSIGDNGAQALSEALKINSTLARLELKENSIGEHGAQALSAALETNFALTWLDLEHNSFGAKGVQALDEARKTNKTVTIYR